MLMCGHKYSFVATNANLCAENPNKMLICFHKRLIWAHNNLFSAQKMLICVHNLLPQNAYLCSETPRKKSSFSPQNTHLSHNVLVRAHKCYFVAINSNSLSQRANLSTENAYLC